MTTSVGHNLSTTSDWVAIFHVRPFCVIVLIVAHENLEYYSENSLIKNLTAVDTPKYLVIWELLWLLNFHNIMPSAAMPLHLIVFHTSDSWKS